MIDRIIIIGAGRTSDSLVRRLSLIAPLEVLDNSPTALQELSVPPPGPVGQEPGSDAPSIVRHRILTKLADGTSRLVLEDIRGNGTATIALVAATGNDRMNLEVCRLGEELAFKPRVAIAIDPLAAPKYESLGARVVVRAHLLGEVVARALQYEGIARATNVGLGQGEILEIQVMPSSPVIGQPLSNLNASGWRVAAIYRDGRLVIPVGNTSIQDEDRVLLVGEPEILSDVAENLRVGVPEFPLRHGPRVVIYLPQGRNRRVEQEAEVLTLKTRATGLVRVYPRAEETRLLIEETAESSPIPVGQREKWFDDAPLDGLTLEEHVRCLLIQRPGVVVAKAEPRTIWERFGGIGGKTARFCNLLSVPVLFPNGAPVFERVVYAVVPNASDMRSADAALDLARMLAVPLRVVRADLPRYFGPPDARLDDLLADVERRASLHGLPVEMLRLEGNPIAQVLRRVTASDLLVVARQRTRRDSFSTPDVALRLARAAPCSVLVLTRGDPRAAGIEEARR